MTACVNNEKKAKGGALAGKVARTFLAGALAATMVPSIALAEPAGGESEAAPLAVVQDSWASADLEWSVAADANGEYKVPVGTEFYLKSATDVFDRPVSISDVEVIYVKADAGSTPGLDFNGTDDDNAAISAAAFDEVGTYFAVAVKGSVDMDGKTKWSDVKTAVSALEYQVEVYEVTPKSLADSFAYEGSDVSDVSFKQLGNDIYVSFADADGNALEMADNSTFESAGNKDAADLLQVASDDIVSKPAGLSVAYDSDTGMLKLSAGAADASDDALAGEVKVVIRGANDYEGEFATVSFDVDAIDLAKDTFTVEPIVAGAGKFSSAVLDQADVAVYVNGEEAKKDLLKLTATEVIEADGTVGTAATYDGSTAANVTLKVEAADTGTSGVDYPGAFVDESKSGKAAAQVVSAKAAITYGGLNLGVAFPASPAKIFVTSKGEAFDASAFKSSVKVDGVEKNPAVSVSVTKGGKQVESWSEPGTYEFTATVAAPKDLAYAAVEKGTFVVIGSQLGSDPDVFVQIDGKPYTTPVEYDGQPVVPDVVAKDGDKTLVAGTDYELTYADADGNAVESVVEPGDYVGTVDFKGAQYVDASGNVNKIENAEFRFTVSKAQIESAEAGQSVYAWTGEAVSPTFTAWTDLGCKGLSVAVDPAKTAVDYYKAVVDPKTGEPYVVGYDKNGNEAQDAKDVVFTGWKYDAANKLSASDVKDAGFYVALVTAPAGDAHFQGTAVQAAQFEVSETAAFEDVDANAWYADVVYKARDNGYMTGIAGTKLFMPEASITRAETAAVMFNMAGQEGSGELYFPTRFSDADGWAWYAEPISWAAQAGVMGGYAGTDLFGVSDKTTREQVACIFYNYAKAQGKDVTVEDADAALAAMADGATVSDWAKEAVAWAVENGVMGNAGSVWAQNPISRAEVAAMAVNFQPEALK